MNEKEVEQCVNDMVANQYWNVPDPDAELLESVLRAYDEAAVQLTHTSEDDKELSQILRSRARLVDELNRLAANAASVIQRAESQLKAHDWRFQARAIALTRTLLMKGSVKSVRTFYGTAGFRTVPAGLTSVGDGLEGPTRVVPARIEPDRAKALKMFRETGEIPPGYELRPAREEFYAK